MPPAEGRENWTDTVKGKRATFAIALVFAGALIPPRWLASALVGRDGLGLFAVVQGVWVLKALLVVHGGLLWVLGSVRLAAARRGSLAALPESPESKRLPAAPLVLAGVLMMGAALRFYDLGNGLWLDEIAALVKYVRLPIGRLLSTFDSQNQHMLYALLARGSMELFGDTAWALRLPAVLFGVGSLAALYWFAVRITTRWEAIMATALLAVSYHHVWFSQNARGYTGLLLWTLLGSGLFLTLLRGSGRPRWGPVVGYGLVMSLAVLTHATAAIVVAAHVVIWLALVWRAPRPLSSEGWMAGAGPLLAGTFSLQLYAIVLPQIFQTLTRPTLEGVAIEWKSPVWFLAETARGLGRALPGGWLTLAAGLVVGAAGLWSYTRQSKTATAVMVLPAILTAIMLLATRHNLWPRFFFFAAGFAALMAIRGVFVLSTTILKGRHMATAIALATFLIIASASTLPRAYGPKQDFIGAREYIRQARTREDAIVALDLAEFPFREYLTEDYRSVATRAELEEIEGKHAKTWVLYTFPSRVAALHPDIWLRLQEAYATAAEFPGTVGGGTVVVKVHESTKG